jgi:hypothetical protein
VKNNTFFHGKNREFKNKIESVLTQTLKSQADRCIKGKNSLTKNGE